MSVVWSQNSNIICVISDKYPTFQPFLDKNFKNSIFINSEK